MSNYRYAEQKTKSKITDLHKKIAKDVGGVVIQNYRDIQIQLDIASEQSKTFTRRQEMIEQSKAKATRNPDILDGVLHREKVLLQEIREYFVIKCPYLVDKELAIDVHTYPVCCVRVTVV